MIPASKPERSYQYLTLPITRFERFSGPSPRNIPGSSKGMLLWLNSVPRKLTGIRATHPPHHRIARGHRFFADRASYETSPSKNGRAIRRSADDVRVAAYLLARGVARQRSSRALYPRASAPLAAIVATGWFCVDSSVSSVVADCVLC